MIKAVTVQNSRINGLANLNNVCELPRSIYPLTAPYGSDNGKLKISIGFQDQRNVLQGIYGKPLSLPHPQKICSLQIN